MSDSNIPVISFTGYYVKDLKLHRYSSKDDFNKLDEDDKKAKIDMNLGITADMSAGKIDMTAHVVRAKQRQIGDVTVTGFFKFNNNSETLEQRRKYLAINGGAMVYPYLRATVSMITAIDDPDTTILPTLNFIEQFKNSKEMPIQDKDI